MKISKLVASTIFGLGLASAATAAPVAVRDAAGGDGVFAAAGLNKAVKISTDSGSTFFGQGAGAFGLEIAVDPALSVFNSFITFCFEIGQGLGSSFPITYESQALATALANNVPPQNSADAAAKIQRLWTARFGDAVNEGGGTFDGVIGADSKERAAAFQVAIWDIAVDNADGLGTGQFRLSTDVDQADVYALATIYLGIAGNTALPTSNVLGLYNGTKQNLLYAPPGGPNGADVPAPASLVLFGAGLIALAVMRRKTSA